MLSVATLNIGHLSSQISSQTQAQQNYYPSQNVANNVFNIAMPFNGQKSENGDNSNSNTVKDLITVPFEWKRNIIEGRVVYVTPSNYMLWSLQEIVSYLQSEGTCKCGLECPLVVSKIFNFDPRLSSKAYNLEECLRDGSTKLCNHRRKNIAIATYQNSIIAEANNLQSNLNHLPVYRTCNINLNNVPLLRSFHSEKELETRLNESNGQTISNNVLNWGSLNSSSNKQCNIVSVINENQTETLMPSSLPLSSSPLETQLNNLNPGVYSAQQVNIEANDANLNYANTYSRHIVSGQRIEKATREQESNTGVIYNLTTCDSHAAELQSSLPQANGHSICTSMFLKRNQNFTDSFDTSEHRFENSESYPQIVHPSLNGGSNVIQSTLNTLTVMNGSPNLLPLHSTSSQIARDSIKSSAITISANQLSPNALNISQTYPSHLSSGVHHSNNSDIHIVHNTSPMPPISVPNVTSVTSSVTEVIPTVGITPQIINTNNTGCPQVVQFLNPLQFASVAPNTVTVLQSTPNGEGTTILIPQIVQSPEQQMMLSSATNVIGQGAATVLPQIGTPGFASIPVHQPFTVTHTQNLNSRTMSSLVKTKTGRTRKKKENRSSRHPPTVAAILREAEENEKRLKEKRRQEEEEKARLEVSRQETNEECNADANRSDK